MFSYLHMMEESNKWYFNYKPSNIPLLFIPNLALYV